MSNKFNKNKLYNDKRIERSYLIFKIKFNFKMKKYKSLILIQLLKN